MFKNSKLSRYKILIIVECFCIDIDATKTALLLKLNRKTANRYFLAFRTLIYAHQVSQKEQLLGVVEVDGSFFGPARVRGTLKQPVFGIYERNGSVYTELVPDCSGKTLQAIIRGKISPESVIHSDGWRGYDGLVDVGYDKHFRINKTKAFAEKAVHIMALRLSGALQNAVFQSVMESKVNFELHLKECEWSYNKPLSNLIAELKKRVSKNKILMV